MSALTTPKGPLPARTYWIRRIVLLAVVLVLVFGAVRLFGGSSDGKADGGVKAVTAGAEVDPDEATAPPEGEQAGASTAEKTGKRAKSQQPIPETTPEATPEPPPPPTPTGVCAPEDVLVMPVVGAPRTDGKVDMVLALRTKTTPACTWTISPETVTIKVSSGDDNYWFSSQCPSAVPSQDVVLYQETETSVPFVWSGKRSDAHCSNLTDWAMPGFYHVSAAAFAGEPTKVQFERGPASITATKTIEPTPNEAKKSKKKNEKKNKKNKSRQQAPQQSGTPEPAGAVEPTLSP